MENNLQEQKAEANQQNLAVQQLLFDTFLQQYVSLSNLVKKLPIPENVRHIALIEFDTGYLWVKEAIGAMNYMQPKPLEAPAPQPPANEDNKENAANPE